jgi:hypothetical protein
MTSPEHLYPFNPGLTEALCRIGLRGVETEDRPMFGRHVPGGWGTEWRPGLDARSEFGSRFPNTPMNRARALVLLRAARKLARPDGVRIEHVKLTLSTACGRTPSYRTLEVTCGGRLAEVLRELGVVMRKPPGLMRPPRMETARGNVEVLEDLIWGLECMLGMYDEEDAT